MADWYPPAAVRRYRLDGGAMVGGPPRIVLHTTETAGVPRYGDPAGANSAPHFTVDADGSVLQHQPISRAARSLRNAAGGVETNRQGSHCVQTEIVGYAKNGSNLPDAQMAALRSLVSWIRQQTGVPASWRNIHRGSQCYGVSSPCRMSDREWVAFTGICGHQEVPENTHWDPGQFTIDLLTIAADGMEDQMLKRGSKGNAVTKVQIALRGWNPSALPKFGTDGDFGAETEQWVMNYQRAAGLDPTGIADGVTVALLMEYVADRVGGAGTHDHPQYSLRGHRHSLGGTTLADA